MLIACSNALKKDNARYDYALRLKSASLSSTDVLSHPVWPSEPSIATWIIHGGSKARLKTGHDYNQQKPFSGSSKIMLCAYNYHSFLFQSLGRTIIAENGGVNRN